MQLLQLQTHIPAPAESSPTRSPYLALSPSRFECRSEHLSCCCPAPHTQQGSAAGSRQGAASARHSRPRAEHTTTPRRQIWAKATDTNLTLQRAEGAVHAWRAERMRGCPSETFIPLPQEETSLNYHVCDPGSHSQVVPRSSRQGLGHRPSPGTSPQKPAEGLAPHFSSSVVYTGLQMGSNLPSIAQYPAETLGLAFFNLCWNLLLAEGTEPRCWLGPTGCSQTASSGAGYQGCSPRKELSLSAVVQRCLWPGQKFPSQQRGWAWHRALLPGTLAAGRDSWHLQPVPGCAGAPGVSCSGRNPD